jgi:hypothetical protein
LNFRELKLKEELQNKRREIDFEAVVKFVKSDKERVAERNLKIFQEFSKKTHVDIDNEKDDLVEKLKEDKLFLKKQIEERNAEMMEKLESFQSHQILLEEKLKLRQGIIIYNLIIYLYRGRRKNREIMFRFSKHFKKNNRRRKDNRVIEK